MSSSPLPNLQGIEEHFLHSWSLFYWTLFKQTFGLDEVLRNMDMTAVWCQNTHLIKQWIYKVAIVAWTAKIRSVG